MFSCLVRGWSCEDSASDVQIGRLVRFNMFLGIRFRGDRHFQLLGWSFLVFNIFMPLVIWLPNIWLAIKVTIVNPIRDIIILLEK